MIDICGWVMAGDVTGGFPVNNGGNAPFCGDNDTHWIVFVILLFLCVGSERVNETVKEQTKKRPCFR